MDSGNSGSMQSSSTGGDEEYDSRAEQSSSSISAFLNSNPHAPPPQPQPQPTTHVGPFSTQQHHVFDPLSNYLDPSPTQRSHPNQILNLDMVWSKVPARSEPDLSAFIPCSSSSSLHNNNQAFLLTQLGAGQSQPRVNSVGAFPTTLPPESASSPRGGGGGLLVNEQLNSNSTNAVRNPKKRSRASRRAPTTVLTTDTTNFRAMVQEFTGIPAPPFTSSSFPRTRLDLFASSNASSSAIREQPPTLTQTQTPPYLLRPFAHKVQAQPSSIPPSSFPPMLNTLASTNNNNYQQHSLNINMHNPILSFQSILQPQPHPLGNNNSSVLVGSKTQQPSLEIPPTAVDSSHLKMGGLEELGLMSHAHVAAHHQNINMVSSSSDGALSRVNNMRGPSSADWAQAQAQRIDNNDGGVLRSLGASGGTLNYRSNVPDQRVKVNFSATPSDFHGDKGPECAVAARSEAIYERILEGFRFDVCFIICVSIW